MCTHLSKRQSTYYFRRVIPAELRPFLDGRREWMVSLGTKDREAAKRMVPPHTMKTDILIDRARRALRRANDVPEMPAEPRNVRAEAFEAAMFEQALEADAFTSQEMAEQEARHDARKEHRDYWGKRIQFTTRELTPQEAAVKDLLGEKDFDLELARNQIAHLKRALDEARLVKNSDVLARPETSVSAPGDVMLDAKVLDLWAAERKPASKTISMHRSDARWLLDRIGRKPVDQITRKDIVDFKVKLVEEGQTAKNIKNKLSRVRTLLQYAADNGYAAANVAAGVTIKDPEAGMKKRLPMSLAALNAIFASPVFANGERPTQGRGEAAYWMPLLAIFTGARLEELGQLRPCDLLQQSYPDPDGNERSAWFIRITVEAGKLKNVASERLVPVHRELERLGFLGYAEAMQKRKCERLFPALTKGPHGNSTHRWGQWFGAYLRKDCGVSDKRMTFHSFRHAFIDYARRPEIPEAVQRRLVGHGGQDVHDDYGEGYGLYWLVEGMKLYQVPNLKLPNSA